MSASQRNGLLVGIAIVAVAIAGAMLFARGRATVTAPRQYSIHGICLACKAESESNHALAEYPPFVCQKCGKQAVYPWFYCQDCQKRFVPDLVRVTPGEPLRVPGWPSCPCSNCRSSRVAQFDPIFQQPLGDAPLPKWEP
jgi:hypothetical protein